MRKTFGVLLIAAGLTLGSWSGRAGGGFGGHAGGFAGHDSGFAGHLPPSRAPAGDRTLAPSRTTARPPSRHGDRDFDHDSDLEDDEEDDFFIGDPFWWADCWWYDWPPGSCYDCCSDCGYAPNQPHADSYYDHGYGWGQVLRHRPAMWDHFVYYLKAYVASSSPSSYDDFRRGFVTGYGKGAESTYDRAMQAASTSRTTSAHNVQRGTNQPASRDASTNRTSQSGS